MTNESITIILPLPSKYLGMNHRPQSRGAWMGISKLRKKQKLTACEKVLECFVESAPWAKAETQATFFHAIARDRDCDNFLSMLKGAHDGIVLAGLLTNDTHKELTPLAPKFEKDIECPRVEIEIRRLA